MRKLQTHAIKAPPRRVDWKDPDDITAMVLVCLGRSDASICGRTALTKSQLQYRKHKAGMRTMDYRNGIANTLGGELGQDLFERAQGLYRRRVSGRLQQSLPTKAQAKREVA